MHACVCGCISSLSAFMVCLPMLLFVSIFTFAYAVRYLSYAQAFQVSSHSLLLILTHSHTHTQSSDTQLMNTPNYGKPTHRLCTSAMAGEEDKSCAGKEVKAVRLVQNMTAFELVFSRSLFFYSLDK